MRTQTSCHHIITFVAVALFCLVLVPRAEAIGFEVGPLEVGGAMRVNYVLGDYEKDGTGAPQRGGHGGDFELDTFRINLDYSHEGWLSKAEYRWYHRYNFLHTGWVGYEDERVGRIEAGLNRTPFGVGPYGPANSWFFDQHYYVGLSDAMRLGVKYTRTIDQLTLDLGYYPMDMVNGRGASDESTRYTYAIVPEDVADIPGVYEMQHQLNARAIYSVDQIATDLGVSAQWSRLDAQDNRASNSDAYAFSVHSRSTMGPVGLMLQLTSYKYDADYARDENGVGPSNDLIVMGAYDFAWPVASKGIIPSVALSYTITPQTEWVDSITFYNDYSVILKDGEVNGKDFNDSALNVTGMAIAKDNWYIYVDYALSSGNYFVGNRDDDYGFGEEEEEPSYANASVGDFGANQNDKWNGRFNINFGYYF